MGGVIAALRMPLITRMRRARRFVAEPDRQLVSLRTVALAGDEPFTAFDDYAELWSHAPAPMGQLEKTYLRAQRFLTGNDLLLTKAMIHSAVEAGVDLIRTTQAAEGGADSAVIEQVIDTRAVEAAAFLNRRAERSARRRYTLGLYVGVFASFAALGLLWLIATFGIGLFTGDDLPAGEYWSLRDGLICLAGGATGAVVSVLLGMRRMSVDYESLTRWSASSRIILGWFFAGALLFLVKGGILTIFDDPTLPLISGDEPGAAVEVQSWFFWGGLGFLAGFNERWVRSLIVRDDDNGP